MAVDKEKLQDESPMLRFCRIILGWDYFRVLKESYKNKGKDGDGASSSFGLMDVKDTYNDLDDYISTFEPLLFEEVKAQITHNSNQDEGIFIFLDKYNSIMIINLLPFILFFL
jgi:senataxin